jgi:TPR repeat protein
MTKRFLVAAALLAACSHRHDIGSAAAAVDAGGWTRLKNQPEACTDLPACTTACDKGSLEDCLKLAYAYSAGDASRRNDTKATQLFEKACALGSGAGCTFVGRMYEFAHGVAKDEARAASAYQRACDLDYITGCYNFAIMLENGRGVARDTKRAAALYQKACQAGVLEACDAPSRLLMTADGGTQGG